MTSINTFIKENIKNIGSSAYVTPDIPVKKLNNAIVAFKCEAFQESILAIYDSTIFGSSKEGLVFTGEKMIFSKGTPVEFAFSDMKIAKHIKNVTINDKGKESVDEYVVVVTKDDEEHKLTSLIMGSFNYKEFSVFLSSIITEFDDYKEEDQLKTISEMPTELKVAYLKIIANMAFVDDEKIDKKELAELFMLMTRLDLDSDSRFLIRSYITEITKETIVPIESLLEIIKEKSESSHYQSLMISLAKDLINVHFSTKNTTERSFGFLDNHKNLFGLSDEEVDLAYATVENDYKLLKDDLDDSAIIKNAKELTAKAAAAGAPLAAVYISGSVIGMSAAGITSGLATLGMGMGMTGGLAIIGLIGVVSYKGMKSLTGANELDKYKTRELMLHDVIKQTQKTTSLIIDDINFLVRKLNDVIINHGDQTDKIKKLVGMVANLTGAVKVVDAKANKHKNSVERIHCPRELDVKRLKLLTDEPTKRELYNIIIENYDIDNNFQLKEGVETETLDKMAKIFEAIGYLEMNNILKGKASEGVNKMKSKMFS